MKRFARLAPRRLGALLALIAPGLAAATGDAADTLARIHARGYVVLGHRESSIPFSYYDDKGRVVGYSHELALKVVDALRHELRLPDLDVRLQKVSSQDRMRRVQDGSVDLECGSTTHNAERAREVAFSTTIFVIGTRLLVHRDSGIRDFPDLAGRRVVTTAGTTSERLLLRMSQDPWMQITVITTRDHAEGMLTLKSGRADALMLDDALLHGELADPDDGQTWIVTGTPQSYEAYACMMRKDDTPFKRVVDAALVRTMRSGEAEQIYRKWFMSPIPPYGMNMNIPLSDAMRALYRNPNDKPFQ